MQPASKKSQAALVSIYQTDEQTNSETFSKEPLRIADCTTQLPKTSVVIEYDERRNGNENEGSEDGG